MSLSEVAKNNRAAWDRYSKEYQDRHGPQLNHRGIVWGVWSLPESEVRAFDQIEGLEFLELGCGAAQLAIAVAKLGGKVKGIDNSEMQLEAAKALIEESQLEIPLYHCSAEKLPFEEESFDVVFCDHGAMSFSPTVPTVKEVCRVLRPGGTFVFNIQSPFHEVCYDLQQNRVVQTLSQNYFEMNQIRDEDDGMISFQHSYGEWIRIFTKNGFEVKDLIELRPDSESQSSYDYVDRAWAEKWPAENIWKLTKKP